MMRVIYIWAIFVLALSCKTKRSSNGDKPVDLVKPKTKHTESDPEGPRGDHDKTAAAPPAIRKNNPLEYGNYNSESISRPASHLNKAAQKITQLQSVSHANKELVDSSDLMKSNHQVLVDAIDILSEVLQSQIGNSDSSRASHLQKEQELAIGRALTELMRIEKKHFKDVSNSMAEKTRAQAILGQLSAKSGLKSGENNSHRINGPGDDSDFTALEIFAVIDKALQATQVSLMTIVEQLKILDLCEAKKHQKYRQRLVFPERKGCRFFSQVGRGEVAGNREKKRLTYKPGKLKRR